MKTCQSLWPLVALMVAGSSMPPETAASSKPIMKNMVRLSLIFFVHLSRWL
jgi:hypothetical protein